MKLLDMQMWLLCCGFRNFDVVQQYFDVLFLVHADFWCFCACNDRHVTGRAGQGLIQDFSSWGGNVDWC